MSTRDHDEAAAAAPLLWRFPGCGQRVQLAYRELHLAVNGSPEQKKAIGALSSLPRPWDPATCTDPELRGQLWSWLDDVVLWLNHEYTWDLTGTIPSCWPHHPHLVREVAVLADQRRRAALAVTSDALEEWHRYGLPMFAERMRGRLRNHCEEGHQSWPGRSRHSRHTSQGDREDREDAYAADLDSLQPREPRLPTTSTPPRLGLVNLDTGEIQDHDD